MGEGAGVDADFVVGRGDESAEDEHRGLLPCELGRQFAKARVVLVELEQDALARLLSREGVEVRLAVDEHLPMANRLDGAATPDARDPLLAAVRPCPKDASCLVVRLLRNIEDCVPLGSKSFVRRRCPDLDRERREGDCPRGEFERRSGTERDGAVFDGGVVGLRRRDVADGIGKAVREAPTMDEAKGIRGAR